MVRTRPHSGGSLGTLYIVWRHLTSHPDRTQHYHISTFHSLGLRESFLYSILREHLRSFQHPAKVCSNLTSLMRPQCGWQPFSSVAIQFLSSKKKKKERKEKPTHLFFQKINKQYTNEPLTLCLWMKIQKKRKLQTQKPTVVNLLAAFIGTKWQMAKNSETQKRVALHKSILIFNKAIYTFLLGVQVACCFPKASATEFKCVDNVLTHYRVVFGKT